MIISVTFFGLQRKAACVDRIRISLSNKSKVDDVFDYINERYPELSLEEDAVLVTVNNRISKRDQILQSNDKICFIPHIGGG